MVNGRRTIFHIDDFSDRHYRCIEEMFALKKRYPKFKATLFTIPFKTSEDHLSEMKKLDWVELAVHGFKHNSNDEMLLLSRDEIIKFFSRVDFGTFVKGFKAPGWRINKTGVEICNELGLWIALHRKHLLSLAPLCSNGFYIYGRRYDAWHSHAGDAEDNWVKKDLPMLLKRWPVDQEFIFVSEAIER
jgi:hypothetical protein